MSIRWKNGTSNRSSGWNRSVKNDRKKKREEDIDGVGDYGEVTIEGTQRREKREEGSDTIRKRYNVILEKTGNRIKRRDASIDSLLSSTS